MSKELVEHMYARLLKEGVLERATNQYVIATVLSPYSDYTDGRQHDADEEHTHLKAQAKSITGQVEGYLFDNMTHSFKERKIQGFPRHELFNAGHDIGTTVIDLIKCDIMKCIDVDNVLFDMYGHNATYSLFDLDSQLQSENIQHPKDLFLVVVSWDTQTSDFRASTGVNVYQYISEALTSGN